MKVNPVEYKPNKVRTGIRINADSVTDLHNGQFEIILPGVEVTELQRTMIRELFPNLTEQVYVLLDREILLDAIVVRNQ